MKVFNIEVIDARTGSTIDFVTVAGYPRYQLRYERDHYGNYRVTDMGSGKTMIALPDFFRRVVRIHPRAVLGCLNVNESVMRQLGFLREVNAG